MANSHITLTGIIDGQLDHTNIDRSVICILRDMIEHAMICPDFGLTKDEQEEAQAVLSKLILILEN